MPARLPCCARLCVLLCTFCHTQLCLAGGGAGREAQQATQGATQQQGGTQGGTQQGDLVLNLTSCAIRIDRGKGRAPLYAQLLADRVYERARVRWLLGPPVETDTERETQSDGVSEIRGAATSTVTIEVANNGPADGYRLEASNNSLKIIGFDERGVLYGVGRLLRLLNCPFSTHKFSVSHLESVSVSVSVSVGVRVSLFSVSTR